MIKTIVTTLLIVLSVHFLNKASKRKSKVDKYGNSIHQLPFFYNIVGIILIIISVIITLVIIIEVETVNFENIIPTILVFLSLGTLILLLGLVNKVTLNSEKIVKRNMFGRIKTINLNEIKYVKFKNFSQYLYIFDGTNKIKCHRYLVGFNEIVSKLCDVTKMTKNEIGIK